MSQHTPHLVLSTQKGAHASHPRTSFLNLTHALSQTIGITTFRALLRRAVFLPIGICLSLLVILSFEFYDLKKATSLALHKEAVHGKVFEVRLLLLELQSGMRGFLLTGDHWFLNPYKIYQSRLSRSLEDLKMLVHMDPNQLEALERVSKDIQLWLQSAQENIAFRKRFATGLPQNFNSFSGSMSYIRKGLLEINSRENEKLRDISHRLVLSQKTVFVVLFGGLLFVMGLLAFLSRYHLTLLARDFSNAQSQLQQSEETFRYLAQSIPEMVWVAHANGKLKWLNESWFRYFGISPGMAFEEMPWAQYLKESEIQKLSEHWNRSVSEKTDFREQFHLRGADGTFRLFELRARPILNAQGELLFFIGTNLDIQQLEDERLEKKFQAKSNTLLNSYLDYEGTLSAITEITVPDLADWSTVSFFGSDTQSPLRFYSFKHIDPLKGQILSDLRSSLVSLGPNSIGALNKGEPLIIENPSDAFLMQHFKKSEHLQMVKALGVQSLAIFPILWGEKLRGVILLAWNRTDKQRITKGIFLAKKLARLSALALKNTGLHEEVRNSVRIRDEFISVASHELKTPLTSLSLQVQLLVRSLEREPDFSQKNIARKAQRSLTFCLDQIHRLDRLLDELLDISRIQRGKLELVTTRTDLSHVLDSVCKRFKSDAEARGVTIECQCSSETIGIWDANRLDQVISNLLSNALKYGNSKPIVCKILQDKEKRVAHLILEDQGIGIAPEMQARIFERFQRANPSQTINGLGLGLYISKMIVDAHQGTIEVKSKPNEGSQFIVTLPLGDEAFHSS